MVTITLYARQKKTQMYREIIFKIVIHVKDFFF